MALSLALCVDASAVETQYSAPDIVYPIYEYDAESNVLLVSIVYLGRGLLALGLSVAYRTEEMEYTGYSRGDGFKGHGTVATLEDLGRINVLTHSGEKLASGEVIRLSFAPRVDAPCLVHLEILPLTSAFAVTEVNGEALPCEVEIINIDYGIYGDSTLLESVCVTENRRADFILNADAAPMPIEITRVDLSGSIERWEVFCDKDFSVDIGGLRGGYVAIIIRPYFVMEEKKIYTSESVYLFSYGEYIE